MMDKFAEGEIAIYCDQGGRNHNKEVTIIGPFLMRVPVIDSWSGKAGRANGHEIEHGALVTGPHGKKACRVFAPIENLRKRKPPGQVRQITQARKGSRPTGDLYSVGKAEELEEA